jgi:hypothetical protein
MNHQISGRMHLGLGSSVSTNAPGVAPHPVSPWVHGRTGADDATPGTAHGAARRTSESARVDAQFVIYRLEEAGRAMLALPNTGYTTRLRTSALDVLRSAVDMRGWDPRHDAGGRLRPAVPDAARITRMDEAMAWIPLIPKDRVVLRRIVGARSLVSPVTERYLFAWRRLGSMLGADHKAVQRWHAQGIDLIVAALNRSV